MSRSGEEFLDLPDAAARAVAGPQSRHVALIEDAFDVLVETPGGGVRLSGAAEGRSRARQAVQALAARVQSGADVDESDVRAAIASARVGDGAQVSGAPVLPLGRKGVIAAKTAAQGRYLADLAAHDLTFGVGPAGTGKTFLAVAYGASLLMRGEVDRLIVTRPAVEAGERLGFLPGDLTEKVDPYLAPIWEALNDIMGADAVRRRRERGDIEVAPIAFMRGRTLSHAFVIVDEAQNASRLQMKMVLTRLGEGARMAVTGDPSQVDLAHPRDSGLAHAVAILEGVKGVAVARFEAADVVRHPLVERIVKAYNADAARYPPEFDMIAVDVAEESWSNAVPELERAVLRAAKAALPTADAGDIAILLTDDATVRDLNARFRGRETATNVLSFPAPESARPHLGDIALAYGVCAREAAEQGKRLDQHLAHLVAHGVLHLLGYDHEREDEAEAMEARERALMAELGWPDPYGAPAQVPAHG